MNVETIILGGGNASGTAEALRRAESMLRSRVGRMIRVSRPMKSEAWGFTGNEFTNVAYRISTTLCPHELLERIHSIEDELGRDRRAEEKERASSGQAYASRLVDLDILLYGEEHVTDTDLEIPHRLILEREFAMQPLEEVTGWSRQETVSRINGIRERK